MKQSYRPVVVVGGGHAGVEAAAAAARRGAHVILVTQKIDQIGVMSCNPSIGGVGKGHIVREIDAFDGIMAQAADAAAIHHRMLNQSKGPAVRGPRVQADRQLYREAIRALLKGLSAITLLEGEATDLKVENGRVAGVALADGAVIEAGAVVLASGTFLGGRIFRGSERLEGGRLNDGPSVRLAMRLRELCKVQGRLKTGTPPRLDGRTIDWAKLTPQPSDQLNWTMSSMTESRRLPALSCAITRTSGRTHAIVKQAMTDSPLATGDMVGRGPRYCPSIEDKIVRFDDRDGHQLFLEPEGLNSHLVYPNGVSTSLPTSVQTAMIASVVGLERARIVTFGYAVEYDFLDPRYLDETLEARELKGLFCAGQINGTTGYEEAAGQGLVAGLNAAARAYSLDPVIFDRASSYIGVMMDDLTLQGVTEPYRMLTARAEYRLTLRADNAEQRLTKLAITAGSLSPKRMAHADEREQRRRRIRDRLLTEHTDEVANLAPAKTLADWAASGDHEQALADRLVEEPAELVAEVAADLRYAPYIERQRREIEQRAANHREIIAPDLNYWAVPGLSKEMAERLDCARPTTLAAASRVQGVTPAALTALLLHSRQ